MREEMTLKEFLGILLKRRRLLIVCGLALAILLGGYKMYADSRTPARDPMPIEDLESIENEIDILALNLEALRVKLENQQEYLDNSLLMQVDAFDIHETRINLCVQTESTGDAQADLEQNEKAIDFYAVLVEDCDLPSILKNTSFEAVEETYLRELITMSTSRGTVLTIKAIGKDESAAKELAEALYKYLDRQQKEVAAIVGEHQLSVLSEKQYVYRSVATYDSQTQAKQLVLTMQQDIADKTIQLADLETSIAPPPEASESKGASSRSWIKYAVVGAVMGVVVAAILALMLDMFSGRARNGTEMARLINSRYLGNLEKPRKKARLDALGNRLCGEDIFTAVAPEDRFPIFIANFLEAAGKGRNFLITGTLPQSSMAALEAKIQEQVGSAYVITAGTNPLTNAQTVEKMKTVDGVLLVTSVKQVKMEQISLLSARVQEAGKPVVGLLAV